jgi:hypothetical protein
VLTPKQFMKLLQDNGWNSRKVSQSLGHDPSWLSKKLHGAREMKCEELLQISKLTGIAPHALLGWDGAEGGPEKLAASAKGSDDAILRELAKLLDPTQRRRFIEILREGRS